MQRRGGGSDAVWPTPYATDLDQLMAEGKKLNN